MNYTTGEGYTLILDDIGYDSVAESIPASLRKFPAGWNFDPVRAYKETVAGRSAAYPHCVA